jgi:hypothetical protein
MLNGIGLIKFTIQHQNSFSATVNEENFIKFRKTLDLIGKQKTPIWKFKETAELKNKEFLFLHYLIAGVGL